ncbi:hypothetical protein WA158_007705 [Blastocystis sp. Blastoise]
MSDTNEPLLKEAKKSSFPLTPFLAITISGLAFSFSTQFLSSNLPFITKQFIPDIKDEEIGYYSGYLTSMYFAGNIPGSILIGYIADHFGRRPCYLFVLISFLLCILLFGYTTNYTLALIIRVFWGIADGYLGLSKTIVSEICDDSNVAMGFSLFQFGMGFGSLIGPIAGGYLSQINSYWPQLITAFPFLKDSPFFVPCIFCGLFIFISIIITYFYLPETLKKEPKINGTDIETVQKETVRAPTYKELFHSKEVFLSILSYGFLSICQSTYDAIIPLWLLNPTEYHGFRFIQTDISWIFTCSGVFQIITIGAIFPYMSQLFTYKKQYIFYGIVYGLIYAFNPIASLVNQDTFWLVPSNSVVSMYRAQVNGLGQVVGSIFRFIGPSLGSSLFAWSCTNNLSFPLHYGFTFYISFLFYSLSIYIVFNYLYTFSKYNYMYNKYVFLTIYIIAIIAVINSFTSLLLPDSINCQKV